MNGRESCRFAQNGKRESLHAAPDAIAWAPATPAERQGQKVKADTGKEVKAMVWGKIPKRTEPGGKRRKKIQTHGHKREHRRDNQKSDGASNRENAPRIIATRDISIKDIVFRDRLRPVRPENAAKLAESLKTLGQTRAISVRPDPEKDGKYRGIAGATLFDAAKSLNWLHVRADIMECTEAEARLWEAVENLYRTELTVLEQAQHQAECVRRIAEVSRQNVPNPKAGRPEGAIAKAARDLPMKGKTQAARRKAIERGLKIAAISAEAKVAVTKAGLDDNRSALHEIAKIENSEEQLQKVQEIIKRQVKKQAPRDDVKKGKKPKGDTDDSTSQRAQGHPDDVILAELKTYCRSELKKAWAQASTKIKRRFLREVLKWDGGKPVAEKD
jgi:hypothetical protein